MQQTLKSNPTEPLIEGDAKCSALKKNPKMPRRKPQHYQKLLRSININAAQRSLDLERYS
jgi:hypothetical protein